MNNLSGSHHRGNETLASGDRGRLNCFQSLFQDCGETVYPVLVCSKVKNRMLLEAINGILAEGRTGRRELALSSTVGRAANFVHSLHCTTLTRSCYSHIMICFVRTGSHAQGLKNFSFQVIFQFHLQVQNLQ